MDTTSSSPSSAVDGGRALVLGGGGSAGNAWLIGVVAGLFDAGLDVTDADLTIGTSAGSTAAAQLTGAAPAELYSATLAPVPPRTAGPTASGASSGTARPAPLADHLDRMRGIIAESADVAELRRRMGAIALASDGAPDASDRWREIVASRLPGAHWPDRRVLITAVDARTGEPVEFDRDSGVELVDAVAASTAGGGFAYRIGDERYIDGGYRANSDNADLASGYGRVVVLSPLGGRSLHPVEWGTHLDVQVDALRAEGSPVEVVFPDGDSLAAFGDNMMNPATRPPSARAGYEQGRRLAEQLEEFWA